MKLKFKNVEDFKFAVEIHSPDYITKPEFNSFMRSHGGELSWGQIDSIFKYLSRK